MIPSVSSANTELQPISATENIPIETAGLYTYAWVVTSKTVSSNTFGGWRVGPTGLGPGSININQSTTLSRSYTNTITGNYTIGKQKIANSLGVTIGKAKTYGTSYSVTLNKGQRKTIIVRPKIKTYKVVSTYYRYPVGTTGNRKAMKTETSYVKVFNNWDYSWRNGY